MQNAYGQKLSKQNLAQPIDTGSVQKCQALIQHGLGLLKQPPVEMDTPERMLVQAVVQWDETPLKGQAEIADGLNQCFINNADIYGRINTRALMINLE